MDTNLERCRTCLVKSDNMTPLSAPSGASNNELNISEVFMMCAAIQINPNDGFSQYACSKCIISAEKAYHFKKQCEHNDKVWNEFSKRLKKKPTFDDETSVVNKCEIDEFKLDPELIEIKYNEVENESLEFYGEVKTETFSCKDCDLIFADEATLSRHELAHTIEPKELVVKEYVIYGCRECSVDVEAAEDFLEHCHILHDNSTEKLYYRCKLCEGDFADLLQLSVHVSNKHNVKLKTIPYGRKRLSNWPRPCRYCALLLKSYKESMKHLNQEHSNLKTFVCSVCGKTFFRQPSLMRHVTTHEEPKAQVCPYCGKGFASTSSLNIHIRIHTGERPYKCDKCNASFPQSASLQSHLLNHETKKNYECKECHKTFLRPGTLRGHMRTHTGHVRKYSCNLCPQQLTTSNALKRHLAVHANLRPHVCKVCGKGFNTSNNIKIHMMTHTGERPYVCTFCKKGFTQANCLRHHTAKYHKDDVEQS